MKPVEAALVALVASLAFLILVIAAAIIVEIS